MSWSLTKDFKQDADLYDSILRDIAMWYLAEIKIRPLDSQIVDGVQQNALLNFITFDLHALIKTEGFVHMQELLQAKGTEQTVMIRLKDLVVSLYIKYGKKRIDKVRENTYKTIDNMYGLTFHSKDIDVNNTFWLYPFFRQIYTVSVPLNI